MNSIFPELGLYGYSAKGWGYLHFLGCFYIVFCRIGVGKMIKELYNKINVNMIIWLGNTKFIK